MKYYHATSFDNAIKIINDGYLKPIVDGVYFCTSCSDCLKFVYVRQRNTKCVIFEVDINESDVSESFDHNESFFNCKAYVSSSSISVMNVTDILCYGLSADEIDKIYENYFSKRGAA